MSDISLKAIPLWITLGAALLVNSTARAQNEPPAKFANLMTTTLAADENLEVTVSRVDISPNFTAPRHYHPGEEFVYVLDGSVTLWQKGKPDTELTEGSIYKIPQSQIHTAITGKDSVSVLVFRVRQSGQSERVLIK